MCLQIGSELQKNWQGQSAADMDQPCGGFVPEKPGNPLCPVACFQKYLSKKSPTVERFFTRPKDRCNPNDEFWYTDRLMGKNFLGDMLKQISIDAELSRLYATIVRKFNNILRNYLQVYESFDPRHRDYVTNGKRIPIGTGTKYFKTQNCERNAIVCSNIQENAIGNGRQFVFNDFRNEKLR